MGELTGKPLGVAVASRVMGWPERGVDESYKGSYPFFRDWAGKLYLYETEEDEFCYTRIWAPWRDKNDMWEVIEKIGTMRFSVKYRFVEVLKGLCPTASTGEKADVMWAFLWLMDTPEVVLRAALKAVEGT